MSIFVKHIEKKRSCVWVWPDTLFWLLRGIGVVVLCVCRCAMYGKHNSLTVVFFPCLFTLSFVCFGEINVAVLAVAFFLLRFCPVVAVLFVPHVLLMFVFALYIGKTTSYLRYVLFWCVVVGFLLHK